MRPSPAFPLAGFFAPLFVVLAALLGGCATVPTPGVSTPSEQELGAYLLVYFNDDTHSLHFALSSDGYSFTDVNGGRPVMDGREISEQKGIRDPHIYRGPDNAFYLAMTDLHIFAQKHGLRDTEWERDGKAYGWGNNRGFVLMRSTDLVHWTRANVRVDRSFPGLEEIGCAWAPQTIYDEKAGRLMLYFTMRFGAGRNRLYYAYVDDAFTRLVTPPSPLFEYPRDVSFIDGDIVRVGDRYHLFYVPHDGTAGIKQAVSDSLAGGYVYDPAWCDPEPRACEAPSAWKRIGEEKWVLAYDIYGIAPHNLGFSETTDFKTFTPLGRFNEGPMKATNFTSPKHPSFIALTSAEARRLADHWGLEKF